MSKTKQRYELDVLADTLENRIGIDASNEIIDRLLRRMTTHASDISATVCAANMRRLRSVIDDADAIRKELGIEP